MSEPDPLGAVFPETFIERLRAALAEDGVAVEGDARAVLKAFCLQGCRARALGLLSLEQTVLDCAKALSTDGAYMHAVFTLGRAAEALASARRLLMFSAQKALEHGFECHTKQHHHVEQPEPDDLAFIN